MIRGSTMGEGSELRKHAQQLVRFQRGDLEILLRLPLSLLRPAVAYFRPVAYPVDVLNNNTGSWRC